MDDSRSEAESCSPSESESDEDALFCSAPKEVASSVVSSARRPGTACNAHRERREKCPRDCPNAVPQSKPTDSTGVREPKSALLAPSRGISSPSTKAVRPAPYAPKPKPTQLHNTQQKNQVPDPTTGGRTGGKTMNPEAIAAYLESLRELRDEDEDEDVDADVESDFEVIQKERFRRQQSPTTDKDMYHWSYQVMRKTWYPHMDEEAAEWTVCGRTYSSLQQANAKADRESTRKRNGYALQPSNAEWGRKMDKEDMVHIYMDCTNHVRKPAFVRIKVVRHLRTLKDGVLPETKFGWLATTVWEIRKTTTTMTTIASPARDEVDELFEEEESDPEPQIETTEEIELLHDSLFTNVDEANRQAASLALDIVVPKPDSKRIDDSLEYSHRRKQESDALDELCDELEADGDNGTFEAEIPIEGVGVVKIEVVGRKLKGPRNI